MCVYVFPCGTHEPTRQSSANSSGLISVGISVSTMKEIQWVVNLIKQFVPISCKAKFRAEKSMPRLGHLNTFQFFTPHSFEIVLVLSSRQPKWLPFLRFSDRNVVFLTYVKCATAQPTLSISTSERLCPSSVHDRNKSWEHLCNLCWY